VSIISVKGLIKRFGDNTVLNGIDADIEKGEVISIIGPSGTGKSTLLRAINFLDPPTADEIRFDGAVLTKVHISAISFV
jgi:ABC-type sugar transport system ATPase subunit